MLQIVKCINECKTQATNAKKLVDNIKENSKQKGTDRTDLLYEPVSDYMSDGSFRALDTELQSTKTDANTLLSHTHEPIGHVLNNTNNISKIAESLNLSFDNKQINTNGFGSGGVGGGEPSPKPSPRLMPKPPTTKPEVPKNKPQILPRKPIMNNVVKTAPNSQLKRPPSEPPPPPLPKSPPPVSAFGIPSDLNSLLSESSSYSSNSQNQSEENYEQIILPLTEDEYLSPISIETPVIMDENKCFAPKAQFSSSQSLNQCLSEDYEPFREMSKSVEQIHQMCISEENYEEVKEFNEINDNHLNYKRSVSQRPLLPKVKETSIVNKSKLISDVFPNIPNWNRNSKDKKSGKERPERQESDTNCDENSLKSHSLEFINHNNSLVMA
ncbi:unnamed protein product [Medioppia subpectinata]|uniref:Uncharacterized protein n=1 Tax=Medioppia subpectinata TaxID=1979941 RepID=A0A7R9KKA2_9ACAR|nr:unnamed protein product [Medioppia subpectinata]CAG2105127.1 unnamed protein product [Medioppia subpectinata]